MKVLMIGPSRNANGGIAAVVNGYYASGIEKLCELHYLESTIDGNVLEKLIFFIKSFGKFRHELEWCDCVHIHMSKSGSFFRKYYYCMRAIKQKKKVIIHIHSSQFLSFFESSNSMVRKMIHNVFSGADKVLVLSEYWKNAFLSIIPSEKMVVLVNGVSIPEQYCKDYSNLNILFLGKVWASKGIYDLLTVFKNIKEKFSSVKLHIGGEGEIKQCEEFCKENDIDDSVVFMGWISGKEKVEALKNSSIYVLPSYSEGLPVSLLEAMSYGCSCVASSVGAIPEIITEDNGILVHPKNNDELEDALTQLCDDVKRRRELGINARASMISQFDQDKITNNLLAIYESLV